MHLTRRSLLVSALASGLLLAQSPARAQDVLADAPAFVQNLGQSALSLLGDTGLTSEDRTARFHELLVTHFDVPTIGRFVLGRYWNQASPEQQQEYLALFEKMLIDVYAYRLNEYSGETFEVGKARKEGERDVLVASRIVRPTGPAVAVDWRLRPQEGGSYRIIDVVVEGVSMAATQRSDFGATIQRSGGKIDGLLEAMRSRQG